MSTVSSRLHRRYPKLSELNRLILWFDKKTEEFVGGVSIDPLPLSVIQKLYNCNLNDPMIGAFDITKKEAMTLSRHTDLVFDFVHYDYSLETSYNYQRAGPWEGGAPFPVPSGD